MVLGEDRSRREPEHRDSIADHEREHDQADVSKECAPGRGLRGADRMRYGAELSSSSAGAGRQRRRPFRGLRQNRQISLRGEQFRRSTRGGCLALKGRVACQKPMNLSTHSPPAPLSRWSRPAALRAPPPWQPGRAARLAAAPAMRAPPVSPASGRPDDEQRYRCRGRARPPAPRQPAEAADAVRRQPPPAPLPLPARLRFSTSRLARDRLTSPATTVLAARPSAMVLPPGAAQTS